MASNPSSPQVVQAIFDSVTRCFNPLDSEESPFFKGCPRPSPGPRDEDPPSRASTPASDNTPTREKSKSRSSSGSGGGSSDVARASPRGNGKSKFDADRYLHRKLEIFRTNSEDLAEMGITRKQMQQGGNRGGRPASQPPKGKHPRARGANTLVYSESSDEITNLTEAHRRVYHSGRCGAADARQDLHPIEALVKLLRDPLGCFQGHAGRVPPALGLCFAAPVRSADGDGGGGDGGAPGDWRRTAEEFAARRPRLRSGCGGPAASRDAEEGGAEGGDEETITSASYFDQKYSHIVESNPPFPLFLESRIAVDELRTDELFNLVKRKGLVSGATGPLSRYREVSRRGPGAGKARDRSPHPIPKGSRASPRPSPSGRRASSSGTAGGSRSGKAKSKQSPSRAGAPKWFQKGHKRRDEAGVPAKKSSSVSSAGSAEEDAARGGGGSRHRSPGPSRRRPPEPDIVHATAAI